MWREKWPIAAAVLPVAARILVAVLLTVLVQLGLLDGAALDACRRVVAPLGPSALWSKP